MVRAKRAIAGLLLLGSIVVAGCAARLDGVGDAPVISHVVLIDLRDEGDAEALIRDCRELLGDIPEVTAISCGRHIETGRQVVVGDYDVGLLVGLPSMAAYKRYLVHPRHVELVSRWKERFAGYRVYDFGTAVAE